MCYYSSVDMYNDDPDEITMLEEYQIYMDENCICNISDDCLCMSFEKFENKRLNEMLDYMSEEYAI